MNYMNVLFMDTANGEGFRTTLYVSGCRNYCDGCFNKEAWDFNAGEEYTDEVNNKIIDSLKDDLVSGITIIGGEPLCDENIDTVIKITKEVKNIGKNVWVFTGYLFEDLLDKYGNDKFKYIDILVDGPFMKDKKDYSLAFRGSSNQRIINVPKSIKKKKVVLYEIV